MSINFLKELKLYKNALDYYTGLTEIEDLSVFKRDEIIRRKAALERKIHAIENALDLLNKTERTIIEQMYVTGDKSADDLCEILSFERSSIYRYRASALKKIACAIFGRE